MFRKGYAHFMKWLRRVKVSEWCPVCNGFARAGMSMGAFKPFKRSFYGVHISCFYDEDFERIVLFYPFEKIKRIYVCVMEF